jgi:hypothetical protein
MDLALHAAPAIAVLIEFLLIERKYTGKAASIGAPIVTVLYGVSYSVWVEYCAAYNGHCEFSEITRNWFTDVM